jgi:hypothetical protein
LFAFIGLSERHFGARPRVPELPQEQSDEVAEVEQGCPQLARQCREGTEEGAGTNREGTFAKAHGRGRRRLQEVDRSEEGQEVGLPPLADRRVHHSADRHGQAAQEGSEKEAEGNQEETETG